MQVHQTWQLVLGAAIGTVGLFILFGSSYECFKSKSLPLDVQQLLVSAVLFTALGVTHLSQAFDWLHQDSHRTGLINLVALPIVFIGLVLLFFLRRAEKKAKADVGTIPLGEHKA